MTLGKIYYLASVFDKINKAGDLLLVTSTLFLAAVFIICLFKDCLTEEEGKVMKKATRNAIVAICLFAIVTIATPSKEDFLIMSITKDYTPQQIYKMTKEEMKDNIDYLIKQIKEIK